jgi:hypothetical protein
MRKHLLINWVYYPPAGHVLEALQHAYGYHCANPEADISLLLNAETALGLTEGCTWLDHVYPVSLAEMVTQGERAPTLRAVPQSWDYVVHNPYVLPEKMVPGWDEEALLLAQPIIQSYFQATEWSGASPGFTVRWNTTGLLAEDTPLPFQANASLRLALPAQARRFAKRYHHDGPTICILPVSTSGLAQSPSPQAWERICATFAEAIPNVRMYITGITYINEAGRRIGFDFGPEDVQAISRRVPGVVACFDIGMWNQLALIAGCDLFCSPHTGFAFVAQFLGAPWLTIAGCPWAEYLFNGVPFYSALPNCPNYPAAAHPDSVCLQRWVAEKQPDCMADEAITERIGDFVTGAQLLLARQLTFEEACQRHIAKLQRTGRNPKYFPYFDGSRSNDDD